jgi:cyclophilin family peptidyl-prolyl cis-trans isomerase
MVGPVQNFVYILSESAVGKHVVFGRVIKGFDDVIKRISEVPVDAKDRPKVPVTIYNCGELELRKKQEDPHQGNHYS